MDTCDEPKTDKSTQTSEEKPIKSKWHSKYLTIGILIVLILLGLLVKSILNKQTNELDKIDQVLGVLYKLLAASAGLPMIGAITHNGTQH
jgi:hypothetical protein